LAEETRIREEEEARIAAEQAAAAQLEAERIAKEEEENEKKKKLKTVMSWRERSREGEIDENEKIMARVKKVNSQEKQVIMKRNSVKSPVVNSPTSQKMDYDHLVKIVLLGDCGVWHCADYTLSFNDVVLKNSVTCFTGVGKTSLQVRYIQDSFRTWYVPTVGTDLKFKTVNVGNSKVKLQVWDTAGKERHIGAAPDFYQKALGYAIVFDVTEPSTFANIKTWMRKVEPYYLANVLVSVILIGNKADCEPEERVCVKCYFVSLESACSFCFFFPSFVVVFLYDCFYCAYRKYHMKKHRQ
jgi:small GTP-binding protein